MSETQNTLYIVRGLPGSGKSTYARTLGIQHFEADDFFYQGDEYCFDPSKLTVAHQECKYNVEDALMSGQDVVVANTFTTIKEIRPYIDLAVKYGARVVIHTCTGDYGSIHGVPEHTIQRMRERFVNDYDVYLHFGNTVNGVIFHTMEDEK